MFTNIPAGAQDRPDPAKTEITPEQVQRIRASGPHETNGTIEAHTGATPLQIFCVQSCCEGLSNEDAAQWVTEIVTRCGPGKEALAYARSRHPERVRRS